MMRKFDALFLCLFLLLGHVINAQEHTFSWAQHSDGDEFVYSTASISDADGNIYTTGYFQGNVDFDPGPGVVSFSKPSAAHDAFITKFDAAGNFVWAKQIGGANETLAEAIAVDASGNVYIAGNYRGEVDFDPGTSISNSTALANTDAFVLKLNPAGEFLWVRTTQGYGNEDARSIKLDATGQIFLTGYFQSLTDFDPGTGVFQIYAGTQGNYTYVLKLDAAGNFGWAKAMGTPSSSTFAYGLALDGEGNVYTGGTFTGTADFDPGAGTATHTSSSYDVYIVKLNTNGEYVWSKSLGGSGGDWGFDLAIDGSGNVLTTGYFSGTMDFDPGAGEALLTAAGGISAFVLKLNTTGDYVWARSVTGGSQAEALIVDGEGSVYTTGYFVGSPDFDPSPAVAVKTAQYSDLFIWKINAAGDYVWAKTIGGSSAEVRGKSITTDATGNLILAGTFSKTADFDPGTGTVNLTSPGFQSMFLVSLSPSATLPITLHNFQAKKDGYAVHLTWQTLLEERAEKFRIERSADARNFTTIGTVTATNRNSGSTYEFKDRQPLAGKNFYRLKMVDTDESFTYSKTIPVSIGGTAGFSLFGNPVTERVLIVLSGQYDKITLQITDASGRVVRQETKNAKGLEMYAMDTKNLPAGHYYLSLQTETEREVKPFIKH